MAFSEDEAIDIADRRLEKQYGPQPFKFHLALRNEAGQVVLDENGDPIISNEYEMRYLYPENRKGEQDASLLQSNYQFVRCTKTDERTRLRRILDGII